MKKILALLLVMVSFVAFAQDGSSQHMKFKGIPIEGSMTEFCRKLKTKGFTSTGRENNTSFFTGDFIGREATVGVIATEDGKNVFAVTIWFYPSGEWNVLVNAYDYCKDLYTRKYGNPSVSEERNPSRSDVNTALMLELEEGTVAYFSTWEVDGGDIQLSIEKSSGMFEGMVTIRYRDSQNMEAKVKHDLEDI